MMLKIQHAHYDRRYILKGELEAVRAIDSKYHPLLEAEISGKHKESRASGAPYKAINQNLEDLIEEADKEGIDIDELHERKQNA